MPHNDFAESCDPAVLTLSVWDEDAKKNKTVLIKVGDDFTEGLTDDWINRRLRRMFILIDECSMLTNSGTTKEAKAMSQECIDKITTLVRLGRAVGIHLIIATQVPDVSSVPTAIRANLDMRVCGKADSILSTMVLGDGRADEQIPKDSHGRFIMANGAESVVFQAYYYDN